MPVKRLNSFDELVHRIERLHNHRFLSFMEKHLKQWRLHRQGLTDAPLAHEDWSYWSRRKSVRYVRFASDDKGDPAFRRVDFHWASELPDNGELL